MKSRNELAATGRLMLGDIGGTNARFALLDHGRLGPVRRYFVADHATVIDAIEAFLADATEHAVQGAVLAAAGPVTDGRCELTNSPWVVDAQQIARRFSLRMAFVVNDFYALAWSLLGLEPVDLHTIGGGIGLSGAPAALVGPGTGLGVSCLVPAPHGPVVIDTEGGHASLAPGNSREDAIVAHLRARFGHASAERALSGMGLQNLYETIARLDGLDATIRTPEEITASAISGSCPISAEAFDVFCAMLGSFAGNLALLYGARAGVFIGGGILPGAVRYLEHSAFRERFEAKGRHRAYLADVPTQVILHPDPAIVGLKALAEHGLDYLGSHAGTALPATDDRK